MNNNTCEAHECFSIEAKLILIHTFLNQSLHQSLIIIKHDVK